MTATVAAPAQRGSLVKINDTTIFYPHQIDGVRTLARRQSFLLADEMGLGKSLQALTVAAIDYEANPNTRMLIVAPASLKWNWAAEMDLHTKFSHLVLDGTPRQRVKQLDTFAEDEHDVLIVNPEQVVAHLTALNELNFAIVIIDEAHIMKNPKAKRTQALQGLEAGRFFVLTGSPLLNQVNELWSLLYRIDPTMFPKYWTFLHRYAVFGGYENKQIIGVKHQRELAERLGNVMLRREKKDVLDLPDKIYVPLLVDLHPLQQKLYKEVIEELRVTLPDSPDPMEIENALTKLLRLKQICGTTRCIPGYEDKSAKLDVAVERVEEVLKNDEHVVIFTQFREVQACMVERLERLKPAIPVYQINGDTPTRERVPMIETWSADKPGVIVAMLQVAGVGLNMTAASTCIFLDQLWVPKLNEQAEDRLHRIGQEKPVTIIKIVARKTIEQRIELILRRKDALFGTIVGDNDRWKRGLIEHVMDDDDL